MTETEFHSHTLSAENTAASTRSAQPSCPFRHGPLTLDLLLGEIGARDTALLDAVLDLRTLLTERADAWETLEKLYGVRRLLGGRAYLAFYKVRCWVRRELIAEVRPTRGAAWEQVRLPLNAGNLNEAMNTCLAQLRDEECPGGQRWNGMVRFRFLEAAISSDISA